MRLFPEHGRASLLQRGAIMTRDLYAEVSARIIAELEAGALPWIKPWAATAGQNVPQNAVSNRPYSGTNVILLWLARSRGWPTPRFHTFKQAIEAGGNVRKGEHGTKVYFVKNYVSGKAMPMRATRSTKRSYPCCASIRSSTLRNAKTCSTAS
jgi:antirestriction protein ArdC